MTGISIQVTAVQTNAQRNAGTIAIEIKADPIFVVPRTNFSFRDNVISVLNWHPVTAPQLPFVVRPSTMQHGNWMEDQIVNDVHLAPCAQMPFVHLHSLT